MTTPASTMTPSQIRSRLTELEALQQKHDARDLDAELAVVYREGGDVDAMETAQLEAERQARRLRVERSALEAELPEAIKREGAEKIAGLVDRHAAIAETAPGLVEQVASSWAQFSEAMKAFAQMQIEADSITREASLTAKKSGAEMPKMGTFQSLRLVEIVKQRNDILTKLHTAESPMTLGFEVHGARID